MKAIADADDLKYDKERLVLAEEDEVGKIKYVIGEYTLLPQSLDAPVEEETWEGNVLLIPPRSNIAPYIVKLRDSFDAISEAIVIVPQEINADWYQQLISMSNAVFYRDEVKVQTLSGDETVSTKDAYAFVYIGKNAGEFLEAYRMRGWGHTVNKVVSRMRWTRYKK